MTESIVGDMPTPNITSNGHRTGTIQISAAPANPAAPASRTPRQQADLERRKAEARAERLKLIQTEGRFVRWLLRLIYVMAVIIAGIGQSTGLVAKMGMPLEIAILIIIAVEGFAIGWAAVATFRRKLGENAYVVYALAIFLSAFAVTLNLWGHYDTSPFLAVVYAVFSAAGFVTFMIESGFSRRDHLWMQNKIDDPAPLYGLRLELRQPKLVARAKQLAIADPGLGRAGSLAAARKSLADDARRAAVLRLVKADLIRTYGQDGADLMTAAVDPDALVDEIAAQAHLKDLGAIYGRRIDPALIEETHALDRAERRKGLFGKRKVRVTTTTPAASVEAGTPPQAAPVRMVRTPGKGQPEAQSKRSSEEWAVEFGSLVDRNNATPGKPPRSLADTSWLASQTGLSTSRIRAIKRGAGMGDA